MKTSSQAAETAATTVAVVPSPGVVPSSGVVPSCGASPPGHGLAAIAPLRYALYVGAAVLLHAGAWALCRDAWPRSLAVPGPRWIPHVGLLVAMVLVRLVPAHSRAVAAIMGVLTTVVVVRPAWGLVLAGFLLLTWGVSRLPVGTLARVVTIVGVTAVLAVMHAWPSARTARAIFGSGVEPLLASVLVVRSLLYQVECGRLAREDRTLLGYLASFATIPLAGGVQLPPITYRRFLGAYGTADAERNLRAGLGLMALGIFYVWLDPALVAPQSSQVTRALGGAARHGALDPALQELGRGAVLVAFGLTSIHKYLVVAGLVFYVVGNLRLLGFNLASGFRYPFISRTFVEYWQRANFYVRDAQLVLYFWPVAGLARRRTRPRLTIALATASAMVGHVLVGTVWTTFVMAGFTAPGRAWALAVGAGQFLVTATLTVVSALRASEASPPRTPSWLRRGAQIGFVFVVLDVNMTLWSLRGAGLSWSQIAKVVGWAFGMGG